MNYHEKRFVACKYCDREAKRNISPDGRNKGHYKTCGSAECLYKVTQNPESNSKKAHHGKDHPLWLEDRSLVKRRPRYELTKWTKAVFERDDYTCQICRERGGRLQADHIKPYALFPELRWVLDNGRTLCVECHKKTPTYARKLEAQIAIFEQSTTALYVRAQRRPQHEECEPEGVVVRN